MIKITNPATLAILKKAAEAEYPAYEKALDVAATTGIGAGGGLGAGALISRLRHGPGEVAIRMAHPNKQQTEAISRAVLRKIRGFNAGARGAIIGGGLGLAYGVRRITKKDGKPLPDVIQAPGAVALAGLSIAGYNNRGKVLNALRGKADRIDMFRGYDEPWDYIAKKERWIGNKKFRDLNNIDKVHINDELAAQLRIKNPGIKKIRPGEAVAPLPGGRDVDDVWGQLRDAKSPYIKATGGDPEGKLYRKMGKSRLAVDVNPDFTKKDISGGKRFTQKIKTPEGVEYEVVRDMSVGGYEITIPPSTDPKKFHESANAIYRDIQKRMGKDFDFSQVAVGPASGKNGKLFIADRKMAGGHLHLQFPIDDTIKYKLVDGKKVLNSESEMREILARRAAFVSLPFDMTHKAMPYRSGLYARTKDLYNEPYGINIVSSRTMNVKPSWNPDPGYINFEHRVSPTYLGGDAAVNAKKIKLMQIVNADPKLARSVDQAMDDIVRATNNETQYLYMPEVRKMLANRYQGVLNKAGIKDPDIDMLLKKYMEGGILKTSAENRAEPRKISPVLVAGVLGSIAAVGGYKYFRRFPKNPTPTQAAAKNGFTVVTEKGVSRKNRLINRFLISPDVDYRAIRKSNEVGNQVYRGVVYHKNWTNDKPWLRNYSRVSGDVTINPPSMHIAREAITDKSKLHKLPGLNHYFQKSYTLDAMLKKERISPETFRAMTDDQAEALLKKLEAKYFGSGKGFMKPIEGEAMGKGTSGLYAPVADIRSRRLTKPKGIIGAMKHGNKPYLKEHSHGLSGIRETPEKYLIQENMNPGGALREVRIHTYDGKVLDTVRRFGAMEGAPTKFFKTPQEREAFEKGLREMYKGVPEFKDTSATRPLAIAFDAVRDATGKIRLVELNPNSGFLFPPHSFSTKPFDYYSTHKLYKHITGRDTGFMAGAKAALIGGGTGLASYKATDAYNKKHAEDAAPEQPAKKKVSPLTYGAAAGIAAGALGYLAFRKPWKKGKFYEVVPSLWHDKPTKTGKTITGIERITREQLRGRTLSPRDAIYANHPMRLHLDEYSLADDALGGARKINFQKQLFHLMNKGDTYTQMPAYSKFLPKIYDPPTPDEMARIRNMVEGKNMNRGIEAFNRLLARRYGLSKGTEFFIKEKGGYGSRGIFFKSSVPSGVDKARKLDQYIYDVAAKKKAHRSPALQWKEFVKRPEEFIVQESIPSGRELRVVTHNGKIVAVADRHGLKGVLQPHAGLSKQEYGALDQYTRQIEAAMQKDIKTPGNTYLGHDIIIPKDRSLGPRLVETNTQEGYYDLFPNSLYRSAMGRDIATVAAGKAALIGAPVAAGTALASAKLSRRNKQKNSN